VPDGDCVEVAVKIGFGPRPIIDEVRRIPKQTTESFASRTTPTQNSETPPEFVDSLRKSIQFEDDFLTDDNEEGEEADNTELQKDLQDEEPKQPKQDPENFDEIPELDFPDF
jgi:hypothetical protein